MKTYVEIIRGLREDRDLKQYDIAEVVGTTQQHYSRYETGESEMPLRVLNALANHYGVSTDYILGRTDCKEGVAGLNNKVDAEQTLGKIASDILSLDASGRAFVLEAVYLQKLKQTCTKKKEAGGPRA